MVPGINGRDLPAPLPQMPANGCMGSPDAQQMRPEGDPFHAGPPPPLNIDDKNGDHLHPLHSHHSSGAVSGREHGGQLVPMEIECTYAECHETMPPVCPSSTGNVPLHHPQAQAQAQAPMSISQMQQQQANGGPYNNGQQHGALLPPSLQNHSGCHSPVDWLPPMPYQSHDHVDHGDQMELLPQGHPAQMCSPQFSNQLPPPPSTLVDPLQNYYPPYADSTHSSAPSKQGHDHELPRGPDLLC